MPRRSPLSSVTPLTPVATDVAGKLTVMVSPPRSEPLGVLEVKFNAQVARAPTVSVLGVAVPVVGATAATNVEVDSATAVGFDVVASVGPAARSLGSRAIAVPPSRERVNGPRDAGRSLFAHLAANGIVVDWREPDVIRAAPTPLYNRYVDCLRFVQAVRDWAA